MQVVCGGLFLGGIAWLKEQLGHSAKNLLFCFVSWKDVERQCHFWVNYLFKRFCSFLMQLSRPDETSHAVVKRF